MVAHDQDEGANARIRYSWLQDYERFGPDTKYLDRVLTDAEISKAIGPHVSPERLTQLQALPSYWFRLDGRTGEIFVHRPLDYETRRGFVFLVLATNPDAEGGSAGTNVAKTQSKTSPSTTQVTINVRLFQILPID